MPASARLRAAGLALLVAGTLATALPASAGVPPAPAVERDDDVVRPEVDRRMRQAGPGERVRVIVSLDVPGGAVKRPGDNRRVRASVLRSLPTGSYRVRARYLHLPAVSLAVGRGALDALARHPRVTAVAADHVVRPALDGAHALTGADRVHRWGLGGRGVTAAVIDSGVDTDHPGLQDDLVGQRCFRTENDCPGGAGSAEDQRGHGTHVTGIITGPRGVAPKVRFHALKVFTTGSTSQTNILNALDWVVDRNAKTPGAVDLVNMSLGVPDLSYNTSAACDAAFPGYVHAFEALRTQGTTTFVATGNEARTNGVSPPGCVTGAVGVGSVGDAFFTNTPEKGCTDHGEPDKVSCFSNTTAVQGEGELLDLLAPGCRITSTWLDGGTATICGTSMASPYAAGAGALVLGLVHGRGDSMSPAELEHLLEGTGTPISDYRIGPSPLFPRVSPPAAIMSLSPTTGVPDGRIKKPGGAPKGNNVYGGARRQTVTTWRRVGRTARFIITVQNDAELAERLRVRGQGSARGYRVRYFDPSGDNVTSRVVNNRLRTPMLDRGRAYRLTAQVRVTRLTSPGSQIRRTLTATSTRAPATTDTVAFKVRRR